MIKLSHLYKVNPRKISYALVLMKKVGRKEEEKNFNNYFFCLLPLKQLFVTPGQI